MKLLPRPANQQTKTTPTGALRRKAKGKRMKPFVNQRKKAELAAPRAFLLAIGMAAAVPCLAQVYVPATIMPNMGAPSNGVKLAWQTIPGKYYDVVTAEQLGEVWMATNGSPVRAQSTISKFADTANRPMRFYRVRERATGPGNTAAITTTTIAETEKILGLTFTPDQRSQMLAILGSTSQDLNRTTYEAMRQIRLLNSDAPSLIFNPAPLGFSFEQTQNPISWSPPQHLMLPNNMADLAFYSVRDLGELIRTRQITSTTLTQLCLDRLKRYNSSLLCVVTLTDYLALQQAARADAEIAAGNYRGPLHGIPCGAKDLFAARGYPTTWGAAPYRDQVIDEDATVVKKLEAAGAVLVAKLAMGSLAMGDVWFGGQTRDPWNLSEGSSGSSAGPAAATAAGLVPFAIGTETWGSIVSPCTRCRVTGLRPTFGRVSRTGAMSLSWSMDKIGPICRYVEDCAIVFEAIRGADGIDEAAINAPFNYDPTLDLTRLRVGYSSGVNSSVQNRLAAIASQSPLVRIMLPNYPYIGMASIISTVEPAAAFDELTRFGGDAFLTAQGTYDWPNYFRVACTVPAVEYLQADRLRKKLIQDMAILMKTVDLFAVTESDDASLAMSNLTGQPCVVIPNGGETSLSFIGKLYDEAKLLAFARAYQNTTGFQTNRPPLFIP
jgi:Asp-tRNA(Asn)/Glu-tRNA(Gln) amidotransferase A subunit family amidase